jgi:hypothetical protein
VALERQWVITQARKGAITEGDMHSQLSALTMQEAALNRELTTHERALDFSNLGNWEARVEAYFADLREWLTSLNVSPETDEERKEQFHLKRQIVLNLVERVTIRRNRKLKSQSVLTSSKSWAAYSAKSRITALTRTHDA